MNLNGGSVAVICIPNKPNIFNEHLRLRLVKNSWLLEVNKHQFRKFIDQNQTCVLKEELKYSVTDFRMNIKDMPGMKVKSKTFQ